jgi:hypothetical protein
MPEDHTNELRDVAFRKIGRNVVNLQRFERMLKLIIVRSDVRGYASELARVHQDKAKDTDRKTMGQLVHGVFNTVYSNNPSNDGPANELNEIWMLLGFRIESDQDSIKNRKRELTVLVEERNLLIHSWLAELDFDSVESCKKLIFLLDEQDNRLKPHYDSLMRLIGNIHLAQQELFKQLETHLRESVSERGDSDSPAF